MQIFAPSQNATSPCEAELDTTGGFTPGCYADENQSANHLVSGGPAEQFPAANEWQTWFLRHFNVLTRG